MYYCNELHMTDGGGPYEAQTTWDGRGVLLQTYNHAVNAVKGGIYISVHPYASPQHYLS